MTYLQVGIENDFNADFFMIQSSSSWTTLKDPPIWFTLADPEVLFTWRLWNGRFGLASNHLLKRFLNFLSEHFSNVFLTKLKAFFWSACKLSTTMPLNLVIAWPFKVTFPGYGKMGFLSIRKIFLLWQPGISHPRRQWKCLPRNL